MRALNGFFFFSCYSRHFHGLIGNLYKLENSHIVRGGIITHHRKFVGDKHKNSLIIEEEIIQFFLGSRSGEGKRNIQDPFKAFKD